MSEKIEKLNDQMAEEISGGVRQDGTVISPVPSKEKAVDFAKAYNISQQIMTKEEYARRFGRELAW